MFKTCQVCGGTIFSRKDMGLNRDGSANEDFCASCYRFGKFAKPQ